MDDKGRCDVDAEVSPLDRCWRTPTAGLAGVGVVPRAGTALGVGVSGGEMGLRDERLVGVTDR